MKTRLLKGSAMQKIRVVFVFNVVYIALVANAVTLPETAQIVPAETILLVDIRDFNQLRMQFEKGPIYRLYKDPAMAAFVESFMGKWRQKMLKEDSPVIKTILDANGLPEGRVAIALVLAENPGGEQAPSLLVISQWGRSADKIKDAIEKIASKSVEQSAHRVVENYRDVNIVTLAIEVPPQQVPDWESFKPDDGNVTMKTVQPPPKKTAYCFIDDCLIASTDVERVRFVVAHIQGVSGSALVADADYVSLMGAVGPYHDVDLYVSVGKLVRRAIANDKTGGKVQMTLSNLGLDNLAGLGCSLGVNRDGNSSVRGKLFLKTSGSRKGVLKMLETRLGPVKPPRFVPASAYSVFFLNVDIKGAFDEFCKMMYGFDPAFAMSLERPLVEAGQEGEPAVSLKPDIIEYIGSEIVIAQSINKPFSIDVMPTETLIALSVNNRVSLEKSLSLVHKRLIVPNNPEATRELLGHTIYTLGPAGVPGLIGVTPFHAPASEPRAMPTVSRMAFTITDTHLILGPEPAVERAIRTLGGAGADSVGSTEWFAKARSAVPSVVGLAGIEDMAASAELMWWMLKESTKARRVNTGIGPASVVLTRPDFWQLGDFALLPEFALVRKYFGCSVFHGSSRADGFLFEFKYLNPRSENAD